MSKKRSKSGTSRIVIVDDHPLLRRGLAALIANEPDLEVCGEAADESGGLQLVEETTPELAIVDITLKSGHGIELVKRIKARAEPTKVLVLSVHDEQLYAERALRAGAMGYLNKEAAAEKVIEAIRRILDGGIYLSEPMLGQLLHRVVDGGDSLDHSAVESLSNRELEVFEWIGQGLTTRQIAKRLALSVKTVETHREHIKEKLKLNNSAELSRHAVQWALENH